MTEFEKSSIESGNAYGYPQCCIDAFVRSGPGKKAPPLKEAKLRYAAAHVNGHYTGFIPCLKHAVEIVFKGLDPNSLIDYKKRTVPLSFPHDWSKK